MLDLRLGCLFSLGLLLVTAGCSPFTRLPRLDSPGNAAAQQLDALYHDPYPLDDLGPPVVGGRPLSYARPLPAVDRSRLLPGTQITTLPSTTLVPQP